VKSILNIGWLTEAHAEPVQQMELTQDSMSISAVPMAHGAGHSSFDYMRLALKMDLIQVVHHFTPGLPGHWLPMAEVVGKSSEPQFLVREFFSGKSLLHDRQLDKKLHDGLAGSTFHLFEQIDLQVWLNSGKDVEMAMLKMDISTLYSLMGEATAQTLLLGLRLGKGQVTSLQRVPPEISRLLHSSFPKHLSGGLRRLHAQAKVLEYLVTLTEHFVEGKGNRRDNIKTQVVRELREELQRLEGSLPNLEEFARSYGVSVRTLNEQFKREYRQSLYSFIAEERLKAAHTALTHSRQAIKVIAVQLGFSDVSSFSKAFTKCFGYPPGSLRRDREF
jgi:AraC-like DNA-binding protein